MRQLYGNPHMDKTTKEFIDAEIDRAYLKSAGPMLSQIALVSRAPNSAMQTSLKKLDREAQKLVEAEERMAVDNAQLEQTLGEYSATMNTTQSLILANDDVIQVAGQAIAIPAILAKVFTPVTAGIVASGANPISPP